MRPPFARLLQIMGLLNAWDCWCVQAVLEAQAETAKHAAEADRLRQQLQYAKRDNTQG